MVRADSGSHIRVVKNGALLATPAINLQATVCPNSERGVLGLAVDPDPASRAICVFDTARSSDATCPLSNGFTDAAGMPRNRVSKFTLGTDDLIEPASEVVLVDGIYSTGGFPNAGDLDSGHDGYLYIATGEGGCDYLGDSGCGSIHNASHDRLVLNGNILRIPTSGDLPADNPFTDAGMASWRLAAATDGTARISWDPQAGTGGSAAIGYRVSRDGVDSFGVGGVRPTVAA